MSEEQEQHTDAAEQRTGARFRINMTVVVRLSSGSLVRAQGKNISKGGVYVEFEASADVGDEFDIMIDLPFSQAIKPMYARAKVARSSLIGGKDVYGIGFQFVNFLSDTEEVLMKYLENRGQSQGSDF